MRDGLVLAQRTLFSQNTPNLRSNIVLFCVNNDAQNLLLPGNYKI
jgi:hypothetical protein